MQEESKEKSKDVSFESLRILSERWKNGTFSEIIDDWKWTFGYSARYKGAIVFYTILGISIAPAILGFLVSADTFPNLSRVILP